MLFHVLFESGNGEPFPIISESEALASRSIEKKKGNKRVRNENLWKKNIRKMKRIKGEMYESVSGKEVPAKEFTEITCPCNHKCHLKIDFGRQRQLFEHFYSLESFDLQSAYIYSQTKVFNTHRSYTKNVLGTRREKTRHYYLSSVSGEEIKVCKEFFKRVLHVSDGRLSRVLNKKYAGDAPPIDQRGKHTPHNKTCLTKINEIKKYIEKFLLYESQFSLHNNPNKKSPNLSLSKIYELYKEETQDPVSQWVFSKEFNLHFQASIPDSFKSSDVDEVKMKVIQNKSEKLN